MTPQPQLSKPRASRAGRQRKLKTMFVRVPARDWARVSTGRQSQFRVAMGGIAAAYGFDNVTLPLPLFVVAYRTSPELKKLMLLEAVHRERLIEITDDGLARAGYSGPRDEAFARFRRDWMIGEKKRFEPNREVVVFTVRLPREDDVDVVGRNLVYHLYGDHLASEE
jgi:hypothetical protein